MDLGGMIEYHLSHMNKKPNLLIIHTDQQSTWTLGCYGGKVVETPHLDQLAKNGALLKNFFTNSAVCTPSRGCFLTGRYPTSHGAYTNNIPLNRDEVTFAEVLKQQGYRTGYVGKWHLDGDPRPGWVHPERGMGFEDNRYMYNRGHWKKIEDFGMNKKDQPVVHPYDVIGDEETYATDYLTNKTLDFLNSEDERPFCHMLSLPDPHSPVEVRSPYDTMYKPEDMPLPTTFNQTDLPDWALDSQKGSSQFGLHVENREEVLKKWLALYYGEVKLIDDSVGRLVDALKASGKLDNTIIVFTSDHGEYAGEHGMQHKNCIYETAYRIPMIVHWPKGISPDTQVEEVMSTVDFQPTLLSLMGFSPSGREEGRDGSSLVLGEREDWDNTAHLHHNTHTIAGIFTDQYELALRQKGEDVLFDRINDPDQIVNLFNSPEHQSTVAELSKLVYEHQNSLETPAVNWLKEKIS